MLNMIKRLVSDLTNRHQLVILGGEHSITYGSYMAYPKETGFVVLMHTMTYVIHLQTAASVMPLT